MKKLFTLAFFCSLSLNLFGQQTNELLAGKAMKKFEQYLPTLLKSKGEGAFIDQVKIFTGDFTKDGTDDVIIWFNYSLGGNAIAGNECAFYETVEDEVKVVAGFAPDYIFTISEIKNGIIYADKTQYAEDDAHCCPSLTTPIELVYYRNKVYVAEGSI